VVDEVFSMMRRKLRIPAFLLVASVMLLGAGCAAGGGASAAAVPVLQPVGNLEKTTLNVAVLPAIDSAGFFVAMNEGLFKQEGLTINYTPAFGDQVLGGQVKGQYDISGLGYVSFIHAQAIHSADLRIIAEGSLLEPGNQVIMVMPHSHIQTLAELRGHVLGVSPDGNIGFLLVSSALEENGIATKTSGFSANSVMFPNAATFPFPATQPLVSGQVAAADMNEPFATQLEEQYGATILADLDSGATQQFPIEGYAATKAWAKANPNTLKAFQIALEAGQQLADTDRAAVEAAFEALKPREGHVDHQTAAVMALNNYPLSISEARLQRVADVMRQFGFLKRHFDINQLLS
jgi:NitT/TauT family transport system substrate-binding protein